MELYHRYLHIFNETLFFKKFKLLSSAGRKAARDPEKLKIFRGLSFVFLSLICAWMGMNFSEEAGIHSYQSTHWPSEKIWITTLKNANLHQQQTLAPWASLLKSLKEAYSRESSIWITRDGCSVYVPKSHYPNQVGAELWTCLSQPNTKPSTVSPEWILLGSGMIGFEKLADFLDKKPPMPVQKSSNLQIPRNIVDPKEIRY